MSKAIIIQDLVKSYAPGAPPAVDRVNLRINPGDLFFLLGPSGCGKTTLLRMIAGFIEPTSGDIRFADQGDAEGRLVTHLPPNKRNTGMVFQSYALWPHMTVFDNVAFGLTVRKLPGDQVKSRVMDALAMVQMTPYAQRKPNALSGGQQQRVALARALVIRPDVLLLDEPLSNLDAKLRVDLRSEIRRICKASGITTVYVTHDQKEALSMADQVAIMQAGRVVQQGPPGALYRAPASRFIAEFLGETSFLPATLVQGAAGLAASTPAGTLTSANTPPPGVASIVVSLRPEALRLTETPGPNTLQGTIDDSVYLGEIAQHTVRLAGGHTLRVAQLNPGPVAPAPGTPVRVSVDAKDVVLVPA
jgi:iron(III) transport system ATP-binding protein